jgi:NAD(P)H-dependent FMN reductase
VRCGGVDPDLGRFRWMPKLMVILASTRPGRVGLPVAEWFVARARAHGGFDVDLVDLAELALPFMDEPNHPRLRAYVHQHTRAWSGRVDAADAFVFVMPEYNYGFSAPLKNAIDYLHHEWAYKPLGLVSYGGVSAGTRAAQMIKQVVTTLHMMPLNTAVAIPFVRQFVGEDGTIHANEIMEEAATAMLDELANWAEAMRPMRERAAKAS